MLRVLSLSDDHRTRWLWRNQHARDWFAFFDVRLVTRDQPFDVVVCSIRQIHDNKYPRGVPLVCEDFHDACTFSIWRRKTLLEHPEIARIFRQIVFRDPQRQNLPFVGTELSLSPFVTQTTGQQPKTHTPLPPEILAKIRLAYPLWGSGVDDVSQRCVALPEAVPSWTQRPIDVLMIGQMAYGKGTAPAYHRKLAWDAAGELTQLTVVRRMTNRSQMATQCIPHHRFHELLRLSRFVLCPYGWAAWTWRDIETIAAGAIPVKPLCDDQQLVADIYTDDRVCWCQPDFSDLADVITKKWPLVEKNEQRYTRELPQWLRSELDISSGVSRVAALLREAATV